MSELVLDQEKLDNILSGLPFTLNEKQLYPYSKDKSKYFGEIHFEYLMLGVKSVNKHYTKTFWGVCTICMSKGKTLDESIVSGQYPQFKMRGLCGCSKINTPEYTHSKENVIEILKGLPKISLVGFGETLELSCIDHGPFTHNRLSVINRKLKHCCPTCISNVKSCSIKKQIKKKKPKVNKYYKYPFDKIPIEYMVGNTYLTSKGNTLLLVEYGTDVLKVECDTCKEVNPIWKTNLKQGQIPCSCSSKKRLVVGDIVTTKHGNNLTIVSEDSKYFYVTCDVCSKDKELWGSPIKTLRGVLYSKSSSCACAGSCIYTREQYIVKSKRRLETFTCKGSVHEIPYKFNQKAVAKYKCGTTGEIYERNLCYFVREQKGCPVCTPNRKKGGYDKSKVGYLYFMYFESKNDGAHFMKVGITNRKVSKRLNDLLRKTKGYSGEIMFAFEFSSGKSCANVEQIFKNIYCSCLDRPLKIRFKRGFTETFSCSFDVLRDLHNDFVGYLSLDITSPYTPTVQLEDLEGTVRQLDVTEY